MTYMQLSERLLTPGLEHSSELIANIQHKQQLLEIGDPEHQKIRTALVIGAGAMRGVYSGGVVIALEELGLTQAFDNVIGISAGAATAAYFLSGQAKLGTSIYYEELASKKFINLARPRNILNIDYMGAVFSYDKPLDQKAIHNNRSHFYIGVTNIDNAEPEYIEVSHTKNDDIIKLIKASSSVPGLAPPIRVGGVLYGDGIATCKNPVGFAVETLGCTDVLYITNQPLRRKETISYSEKIMSKVVTKSYPKGVKKAYLERHTMSDETASKTYPPDVNIGILCPAKTPFGRLTKDPNKMIRVAEEARLQTKAVFKN